MRLLRVAPIVVLLAVSMWGCSDYINTGSPTTPTVPTPTPTLKTETFTGSITTGGQSYHVFNVLAGRVDTTLTDLGGAANQQVGMAVVVASVLDPNNLNIPGNLLGCSLVLQNDAAIKGITMVSTASTSIIICLRVYDPTTSTVTGDTPYTVTVTHY